MASKIEIAPYDGKIDFGSWKKRMRALLSHNKVLISLELDEKKWSAEQVKKKAEIDEEAYNLMILSLSDTVLRKVDGSNTTVELWGKLDSLYSSHTASNLIYVKGALMAYKMDSAKSIDDNVDEFLKLSLLLKGTEDELSSSSLALILLNSLPESYQVVKDALQYTGTIPKIELILSGLKARELELRLNRKSGNNLFVKGNHSTSSQGYRKEKKKKVFQKNNTEIRKCFHCGKSGHLKKNCYDWIKKSKQNNESNIASSSKTELDYYEVLCASSAASNVVFGSKIDHGYYEVLYATDDTVKDKWIVDSGCSFHMSPDKLAFCDLIESKLDESVYMGNDNPCKVVGMGSIVLYLTNGNRIKLQKVRYVPGLKRNLISLGELDEIGCTYKGGNGVMDIFKGKKLVLSSIKSNGIYFLNGQSEHPSANAITVGTNFSETEKWHLRLGHMSSKGLKVLHNNGQLGKFSLSDLNFCEPCVLGKQHRLSFGKGIHLSTHKLDYVHSDLWGPEKCPTHGNNRFFLSIVDDYTRRVWVYLLKTKDEAFTRFKEWKTLEENQVGKSLKGLRTDNGLEFCNEEFDNYCKDHGILRHRTVRKTPQQNGVAERMNRTLLEKVRCLLFTSSLPKSFWGEALSTAAYLINHSPSFALDLKSPLEVWHNRKPDLNHLRIFGCAAYAHTREGKLDPKSIKCIFLGYQQPHGTKGYRLWEREARGVKIIVSRDVIFNELSFPCKSSNNESSTDNTVEPESTSFEVEPIDPIGVGEIENETNEPTHVEVGEGNELDNDDNNPDTVVQAENTNQDELGSYLLARDRDRREIRTPARFSYADLVFSALVAAQSVQKSEPSSYSEAIRSNQKDKWVEAMESEMNSLRINQTWVLITKPKNKRLVQCKWLYKIKDGIDSNDPPRYKARLVAKGFTQKEGVDYKEIFSPVVKFKTIRIMLALVVQHDLELEQLDVTTAFLYGELDEDIIMAQPEGFVDKKFPDKVCLLKKSLYGLKQSPRQWYKRFDTFITSLGFSRSNYDSCFYFKFDGETPIYLLLYVDDMLLISKSVNCIKDIKSKLSLEFDMKDLGNAKKILGMIISRDRNNSTLKIHQKPYLEKLVEKFGNKASKPVSMPLASHHILDKSQCPRSESEIAKMSDRPYANVIGSIMYAMISSRPDLSYSISLLSRFMSNPGTDHWTALKWSVNYINCTRDIGLVYRKSDKFDLVGYVDSDFAGDRDSRKSTTAYVFTLGGNCVVWKSQLQPLVALSTTEAEYVALADCTREFIWLQGLLKEARLLDSSVTIFSDSQSAIHLSKNPVYHERTKHVDIRFHFLRELIAAGTLKVEKVATEDNPSDMGTKILPVTKFKHCLNLLQIGES